MTYTLNGVTAKGFTKSGAITSNPCQIYVNTVVAELEKEAVNLFPLWVQYIGLGIFVLSFILVGTIWARIIWVYSPLFRGWIVFPILGEIVADMLLLFLGMIFMGPESKKQKNSIKAAKFLNVYYEKHKSGIELALASFGYRIVWEIKYTENETSQIQFQGGRNKTVKKRVYSSSGHFKVEKISLGVDSPPVTVNVDQNTDGLVVPVVSPTLPPIVRPHQPVLQCIRANYNDIDLDRIPMAEQIDVRPQPMQLNKMPDIQEVQIKKDTGLSYAKPQ